MTMNKQECKDKKGGKRRIDLKEVKRMRGRFDFFVT